MFYVLFGIVLGRDNPANRDETATYLLATMACYGVMGVAMFSFGVGIAMERGQGWLQVKRASPMPLPAISWPRSPMPWCSHGDLAGAAGRGIRVRRSSFELRNGGVS